MIGKRKSSIDEVHTNSNKRAHRGGFTKETAIVISEDEGSPEVEIAEEIQDDLYQSSFESPIKLLFCPALDSTSDPNPNNETVMVSELIGVKDLEETYQFNFSVDLEFFLTLLHPNFVKNKKKITFITGSSLLADNDTTTQFIKDKFNISEVIARIPNRYGTHHTKMMINFFEDNTLEIVIMTCNMTKLDLGGLTQMCWRSGKLNKSQVESYESSVTGIRFKTDILNYLLKYNNARLNTLTSLLKNYDFSSIEVELIASSPGSYDLSNIGDQDEIYGYGKLRQVLKRNNLLIDNTKKEKKYNVLAQASSISFPFATSKGQTSSIFTHLLCPLFFSNNSELFKYLKPGSQSSKIHQKDLNYIPNIIFPSVKDISENCVGFGAGCAIHFNYTQSYLHKNQYEQNIKPYLHVWNPNTGIVTGREKVAPHVKLYMVDNGNSWSSLRWILMGSHNLSKQAWGGSKGSSTISTDPTKYDISSYELGVLIPGNKKQLIPAYCSNKSELKNSLPVRLPFKLPPKKYGKDEKPWSTLLKLGDNIKDIHGNVFN